MEFGLCSVYLMPNACYVLAWLKNSRLIYHCLCAVSIGREFSSGARMACLYALNQLPMRRSGRLLRDTTDVASAWHVRCWV